MDQSSKLLKEEACDVERGQRMVGLGELGERIGGWQPK